jgi:ferritin-like protein
MAKEILGIDSEVIIEELNRAAAAELHDAYRYRLLAKIAEGHHATELAEWFEKTSEDEWHHLGIWMDRILTLGGRPFNRPGDAEELTYTAYADPPANPTDIRTMIEDSLRGERAAIRFYKGLYELTREADPVTAKMALEAMEDEIGDEDDLEKFLSATHVGKAELALPLGA